MVPAEYPSKGTGVAARLAAVNRAQVSTIRRNMAARLRIVIDVVTMEPACIKSAHSFLISPIIVRQFYASDEAGGNLNALK
jgi:hypothetical protein